MVLWCYGIYDRTADAHNEVTIITLCKDLKAVSAPFEDKLPYNKHKSFLFFPFSFLLLFLPFFFLPITSTAAVAFIISCAYYSTVYPQRELLPLLDDLYKK